MIENNEKCPCGSGEIVAECCGKTDKAGMNQIELELTAILNSYFEIDLSPAEVQKLENLLEEWGGRLGQWMEEEELLQNVSNYYFFIVRKDLWRRHLVKALNRTQNKAVRAILRNWQNAFVTFAEVVSSDEHAYRLKEVLGEGEYFLRKEPQEPQDVRLIFAIALEELHSGERWITPISAAAVNEHASEELKEKVTAIAEASDAKNSSEFFKEHLIDIYEEIGRLDAQTLMEAIDQSFTQLQRDAVDALDQRLENEEMEPGAYEMLISLMAFYFTDEQPKFRKAEVPAAGAFMLASDIGMMERTYTQTEVAKLFGVSVSSFKKHQEALFEKIDELNRLQRSGESGEEYFIGTDPHPAEQTNWQVHMYSQDQSFDTLEEAQSHIQQLMTKPFNPKNEQQEAQQLSYMAYNAETIEQRQDFARQAYGADSENVDALLLHTELTGSEEEQEAFFKRAIAAGEKQFDPRAENAWAFATNRPYLRGLFRYGVWLFERGRLEEASELFLRLLTIDLYDNQGARYFAVSALIRQGETEQAEQVLKACEEMSAGDAAYWYLSWLLSMGGESDPIQAANFFVHAEQANPYVGALIHTSAEKKPYPLLDIIKPGSPEEAQFIWYLM